MGRGAVTPKAGGAAAAPDRVPGGTVGQAAHLGAEPEDADRSGDEVPCRDDRPGVLAKAAGDCAYDEPSSYRGNTYWGGDGDGVFKVGYSSWEWPTVRVRSYFQFDIGALHGSQIRGAETNILEIHAPSCAPKWVDLYHTGGIGPGLSWNNQPALIQKVGWAEVAHGYNGCGPNWVGFDVGGAVASSVNARGQTVTFGLISGDENATYEGNLSWKKFDPNPNLIVTYNNRPFAPSDLASEPQGVVASSRTSRTSRPRRRF